MKKVILTGLTVALIASCAHRDSRSEAKAEDLIGSIDGNVGFRNVSNRVSTTSNGAFETVNAGSNAAAVNEPVSNSEEMPEDALHGSIPKPFEQKLIKNGQINFKVKNLGETRANIQKAVILAGGYVASENSYGYEDNPSEQVVIRVPAAQFDKVLEEILNGAETVDSKNVTIEDVTEEYVDIEARLKNKKQLEERYQALLAKATKVEDMLAIEREISVIRQEIEASEGRMRYLNNRVGFGTITLNYYEKKISGFNFGGKLGRGMAEGGEGLLYFIIGICSMWPLWLMAALFWFLIARWIRRRRKRKQAATA